ncbi:hypothetical protein M440DRAFT_1050619 [Trichoderma longibrachiatum ATCC 18648]|uniref:Uncharacterized protein n=1 Tax=Trichoderma longibrachiatum ATCC 18648 TaxID=983965 RepID=A0A2T4BWW0_TRILO|nr:hypothetical protein M440DRAFT_1050619 [Trichoderma longibrachiatum ATCC 18648]
MILYSTICGKERDVIAPLLVSLAGVCFTQTWLAWLDLYNQSDTAVLPGTYRRSVTPMIRECEGTCLIDNKEIETFWTDAIAHDTSHCLPGGIDRADR